MNQRHLVVQRRRDNAHFIEANCLVFAGAGKSRWKLEHIATLELDGKKVIRRLPWTEVPDLNSPRMTHSTTRYGRYEAHEGGADTDFRIQGYVIPADIEVGDFLEIRSRTFLSAARMQTHNWYYIVTDLGDLPLWRGHEARGASRQERLQSRTLIAVSGTKDKATPVLQRQEEVLALVGRDRQGLIHQARRALERLNPSERRRVFMAFPEGRR